MVILFQGADWEGKDEGIKYNQIIGLKSCYKYSEF